MRMGLAGRWSWGAEGGGGWGRGGALFAEDYAGKSG